MGSDNGILLCSHHWNQGTECFHPILCLPGKQLPLHPQLPNCSMFLDLFYHKLNNAYILYKLLSIYGTFHSLKSSICLLKLMTNAKDPKEKPSKHCHYFNGQ